MGRKHCGGKGENAGHQHFLLFPTMFSKAFFSRGVKSWDCVAMGLKPYVTCYLFTTQSQHLTTPIEKPFENIMGKGENAGNQNFLLFPQCF